MLSGLTGVGMVELLASINEYAKRPILIVTYNEIQAKEISGNIKAFIDKGDIFPKKEIVTYDYIAESKDLPYERIEILSKIKVVILYLQIIYSNIQHRYTDILVQEPLHIV